MLTETLKRLLYKYAVARNVLRRRHRSRALLSYIVHPFLPFGQRKHHPNVEQMHALISVLDDAGFIVDVADYRVSARMVRMNYDLYFGFGDALEYVAKNLRPNQKLIAYATGRAAPYQAAESIRRGIEYQREYGFFPTHSLRIPSALWTFQLTQAHGLIMIGDKATASTFDCYPARPFQIRERVSATHWAKTDGFSLAENRNWNSAKFNLLWFGGNNVVHKGLDLCIGAVSRLPNVTLQVCGVSARERETVDRCISYYPGVEKRIKFHGFVHPHSEQFVDVVKGCAFALLPSCSEGQATSVLTAVAGGGLIPILSDRCGCNDIPTPFWIDGLSVPEVVDAIRNAMERNGQELATIAIACARHVMEEHNVKKYKEKIRRVVSEVIKGVGEGCEPLQSQISFGTNAQQKSR